MKLRHERFNSAAAFVEHARALPVRFSRMSTDWHYGREETLDAAAARLIGGTCRPEELDAAYELAAQCRAEMEALGDIGTTRRRRLRWSDEGAEPDAARYLAGHDDCWLRVEIGRELPTIRLGISSCQSCGNSDADFRSVAARAAAVADALTARGYGVGIDVIVFAYDNDGRWVGPSFPIKSPGEALDLPRVLSIGTPALLRDLAFRWYDANGNHDPYGRAKEPTRELLDALGIDYLVSKSWSSIGEAMQQALRHVGATFDA